MYISGFVSETINTWQICEEFFGCGYCYILYNNIVTIQEVSWLPTHTPTGVWYSQRGDECRGAVGKG